MKYKSKSPRETQQIGQNLAKDLKPGDVVALYGDLGAGKTTFVQGLAKGLKIKSKLISPTFVFMRQYPITIAKNQYIFFHIDLYRSQHESDLISLGLSEVLSPDSLVVIEWAQKIKNRLPKHRLEVFFETINNGYRRIEIKRN